MTPTTSPADRQRREIEDTRADMGRTLERIEDRVSPTRIKERQADRLRGRWDRTKDMVMGSDPHGQGVTDQMSDAADDAVNAVQEAPEQLENATRGNPIAAGLIAAGVGALVGSLIPSSEPERALGTKLRDEFEEPVRSELQHAGQEMRDEFQEDAEASAAEVKDVAQESFQRTKEEAEDSAHRVKDETQEAVQEQRSDEDDRPAPPPPGAQGNRSSSGSLPASSPTRPESSPQSLRTPPPPPR